MFKRQISPRAAAIATVVILAAIQLVYWRLLVYRELHQFPMAGGPAAGGATTTVAVGRQDVEVDDLTGGGPGYQDGPAWKAQFYGPSALAIDKDGNLLVADSMNHRIRRVTPKGVVSTVAGSGPAGGSGGRADGPALQARFSYPSGVAVDQSGVIYVSDAGNHRICRIKDGAVSTLASDPAQFAAPGALTVAENALWVADVGGHSIRRVGMDGAVSTATDAPAPVKEALGDISPTPAAGPITASPEGIGEASPSIYKLGRSAPVVSKGPRVFADVKNHVIMARVPGLAPLLLAGRRMPDEVVSGSKNGIGSRATFELPCAVAVASPELAYVADHDANRIRRLTLPSWLGEGSPAPDAPRIRMQRWRRYSGR